MDTQIENAPPRERGGASENISRAANVSEDTHPPHRKQSQRKRVTARVIEPDGVRLVEPSGRDAQTLEALISAGRQGITALDLSSWAVRLSHYIFKLRRTYGLAIDMIEESHGGEFPGKHGRYFLRSQVELLREAA